MRRNDFFASSEAGIPGRLNVWAVAYPGLIDYIRHGALREPREPHPAHELLAAPDVSDLDGEDRGF